MRKYLSKFTSVEEATSYKGELIAPHVSYIEDPQYVLFSEGIQAGEVVEVSSNADNPAFLQAGGNVGGTLETRFILVDGQNQMILSSNGKVIVKSIQGGEVVQETYGALSDTTVTINADAGTEVVIYGDVTKIDNVLSYPRNIFASLDVSKNTALTYLSCVNCIGLTSLDVSKNTALTYLACNDCTDLTSINGIAVNSEVSTTIASVITNATSVDGTVTLRQGDEFNQTIIDAAMDKGWDVQYYAS